MAESNCIELSVDELDDIESRLSMIDAQVDILAMLVSTGDITSLKKGTLCGFVLSLDERITAARERFDEIRGAGKGASHA